MLWGTWFVLFDPLTVSHTYHHLGVLSHYVWGFIFYSVAAAKIYSILNNRYKIRRAAAFCSVLLWIAMATFFAMGNYQSHLIPTCLFFGYQSFLSWHRISPLTSK